MYFQTGSAELGTDAMRQLDWFVEKMAPYPQATFDVQGFADSTGSEGTNQKLSDQRAQAVSSYLQSKGIAVGADLRRRVLHQLARGDQRHLGRPQGQSPGRDHGPVEGDPP